MESITRDMSREMSTLTRIQVKQIQMNYVVNQLYIYDFQCNAESARTLHLSKNFETSLDHGTVTIGISSVWGRKATEHGVGKHLKTLI